MLRQLLLLSLLPLAACGPGFQEATPETDASLGGADATRSQGLAYPTRRARL